MKTTPTTVNASVERTIAASPQDLYAIVADVTRIGELSPECTGAEWVGGATHAVEGARFKGKNELGSSRWSTKPVVTEVREGEVFEFKVPMGFGPTWRYEFHPCEGGTRVVESVHQEKVSPWFIRRAQRKAGVTDRTANVTQAMEQTLANLESVALATTVS